MTCEITGLKRSVNKTRKDIIKNGTMRTIMGTTSVTDYILNKELNVVVI
jgi:hypothetical protein